MELVTLEESRILRILDPVSLESVVADLVFQDGNHNQEMANKVKPANSKLDECLEICPNTVMMMLVRILDSSSKETRLKVSIVLEYVLSIKSNPIHQRIWLGPEVTRQFVASRVLEFASKEEDTHIRDRLLELVLYKISRNLCLKDCLSVLFESNDFDLASKQFCAFKTITFLSPWNLDLLVPHFDLIHSLFCKTFSTSESPKIQVESLNSIASLSDSISRHSNFENHFAKFKELVPLILNTFRICWNFIGKKRWLIGIMRSFPSSFLGTKECCELEEEFFEVELSRSEDNISVMILQASDLRPLEALITMLSSYDDSVRTRATKQMECLLKNEPGFLIKKLGEIICGISILDIKIEALTFLYDNLSNFWPSLESFEKSMFKTQVLKCLKESVEEEMLYMLYGLLRRFLLYPSVGWPKLISELVEWTDSLSNIGRVRGLKVLGELSSEITTTCSHSLNCINAALLRCLHNCKSLTVRMTSVFASLQFVNCLTTASDKHYFRNLVPDMMVALVDSSKYGENLLLIRSLEELFHIVRVDPSFFSEEIDTVVSSFLHIAENATIDRCRLLAAVSLLMISEAGLMLNTAPSEFSRLFAVFLRILYETEVFPSLHYVDDDGSNTDSDSSLENENIRVTDGDGSVKEDEDSFIRRFALSTSMPTGKMEIVSLGSLYRYFTSEEWEKRYAAIVAFEKISKSCLMHNLKLVVNMLLERVTDSNTTVRLAALTGISKLSKSLGSDFRYSFGEIIVPVLNQALNDYSNAEVQVQANLTLEEFKK